MTRLSFASNSCSSFFAPRPSTQVRCSRLKHRYFTDGTKRKRREQACISTSSSTADSSDGDTTASSTPLVSSVVLNLRGADVLPSLVSLTRYMRDLRPKLDYLGPNARQLVLSALEVATVAHSGQKRKSGEPFIIHPVAVASILADLQMDRDSVIAGLLHDTVEDTPFTLGEIEVLFGIDVRRIVEGETKMSKLASKVHGSNARAFVKPEHFSTKAEEEQEKQADNLRGMFLAMTEDVRVIIVKLADRLHNMRTLEHMKPAKQKKIAKETLEFFAPLAHRLGMRRIKAELEDLSFKYLYPVDYREINTIIDSIKTRSRSDHYLRDARMTLKSILEKDQILKNMIKSLDVVCVSKSLYAVHKRCQQGESLSSMLDIVNLCVVVDVDPVVNNTAACYHVLGRIHHMWKPLPKRFKDYIAFPKPNGYQSLHTTVLLGQTQDFFAMEIHIRTKVMHHVAQEGIAAELFHSSANTHPRIGASTNSNREVEEEDGLDPEWRKRTQGWLISIRDYIDSFSSSRDLVDAVRRDLLGNRVFVFTPKGRIMDLPKDSTPVDLAYRIHTDVGHKMIGARANGKMVNLDYKLQNADVVKVITSNSSPGPSSEWMGYAKSRTARQRIRAFLKSRDRDNMLERGRVFLEARAKKQGYTPPSEAALIEIIPRLSAVLLASSGITDVNSIDELYIAIAKGGPESADGIDSRINFEDTVLSMVSDRQYTVPSLPQSPPGGALEKVEVGTKRTTSPREVANKVKSAVCCHPVRGDEVMGIRDGDTIIVHRLHCEHLLSELRQRPVSWRVVGVRWKTAVSAPYRPVGRGITARVVVIAQDCDGLLSYVSGVLSGMGRSIRRAYTATDPVAMVATLAFEVLVEDVEQLQSIIQRIEECDEVIEVRRVGPNEGVEFFPPQLTRRFSKNNEKLGGEDIVLDSVEIDELYDSNASGEMYR